MVLPVMVISGGDEEARGPAAVSAFDAGGNEYMARPVHTGEFKCRVLNLLKLTGRRRGAASLLKVDGLLLDPSRRQVSRDGIELKMTPRNSTYCTILPLIWVKSVPETRFYSRYGGIIFTLTLMWWMSTSGISV